MGMFSAQKKLRNTNAGFTLVELLVTISIFVILTGIVLFSQSKFNSTILLTNLAYDTALTIRQAQTYGINIKNFSNTSVSDNNFLPYGVHFDQSANRSFILFADMDYDFNTKESDSQYNGNGSDSPDLSLCQGDLGCVNRYNITRGNYILGLCLNDSTNCDLRSVDIVFKRPNPEAIIHAIDVGGTDISIDNISRVRIKLGNLISDDVRYVTVQPNGLISIEKE